MHFALGNLRIHIQGHVRAVRIELALEAAEHVVAELQIDQAQRAVDLRRSSRTFAGQMETQLPADGQAGRLHALDPGERHHRAGDVEHDLCIAGAVEDIAGEHAGRSRSLRTAGRRRRHQAQFGVGDADFALTQRDLAASAIELPAPALRIDHVEEAFHGGIGASAASVKIAGKHSVNGIGPAQQRLQAVGIGAHQRGVKIPHAGGIEAPIIEVERDFELRAGRTSAGGGAQQTEIARLVDEIAFEGIPVKSVVASLRAFDVARKRGACQGAGDAALPVEFAADDCRLGVFAADGVDEIVPGNGIVRLQENVDGRIGSAQDAVHTQAARWRGDFAGGQSASVRGHGVVIIHVRGGGNLSGLQLRRGRPERDAARIDILKIRLPRSDRIDVECGVPVQRVDGEIGIIDGGQGGSQTDPLDVRLRAEGQVGEGQAHLAGEGAAQSRRRKIGHGQQSLVGVVAPPRSESSGMKPLEMKRHAFTGIVAVQSQFARAVIALAVEIDASVGRCRLPQNGADVLQGPAGRDSGNSRRAGRNRRR